MAEFRIIPGYADYRVGDDGSVWSRRPRNGKPSKRQVPWRRLTPKTSDGRERVTLCDGTTKRDFQVASLVLTCFVGPRPEGMETCHDPDPSPLNSRLDNLRWDTRKANCADAARHGRSSRGSHRPAAKLSEQMVPQVRARLAAGESQRQVAAQIGVSQGTLSKLASGLIWKHVPQEG